MLPNEEASRILDFANPYLGETGAVLLDLWKAQILWVDKANRPEANVWKDTNPAPDKKMREQ